MKIPWEISVPKLALIIYQISPLLRDTHLPPLSTLSHVLPAINGEKNSTSPRHALRGRLDVNWCSARTINATLLGLPRVWLLAGVDVSPGACRMNVAFSSNSLEPFVVALHPSKRSSLGFHDDLVGSRPLPHLVAFLSSLWHLSVRVKENFHGGWKSVPL
jgi:hypothetical protein